MWAEYLYPFALYVFMIVSVALILGTWLWWKHILWVIVDGVWDLVDKVFYWLMDKIMGCKSGIDTSHDFPPSVLDILDKYKRGRE